MNNIERKKLIDVSIEMFIENVRIKKWLDEFKKYEYFTQMTPENIKEAHERIEREIEEMIEEAERNAERY